MKNNYVKGTVFLQSDKKAFKPDSWQLSYAANILNIIELYT